MCFLSTYPLDHDKSMPCNDLFQTEEHIVNDHEARFDDPRGEDFAEDMDESAGLLSPTNYMGEHSEIWWEDDTGDGEICVVCASLRWNREGDVVRNIEEWGKAIRLLSCYLALSFFAPLNCKYWE